MEADEREMIRNMIDMHGSGIDFRKIAAAVQPWPRSVEADHACRSAAGRLGHTWGTTAGRYIYEKRPREATTLGLALGLQLEIP